MPELTLDEHLVGMWRKTLAEMRPSPGSKLRFVMIGTGPMTLGPGHRDDNRMINRAVVLDRAGRELMQQDKRHPFTMDEEMVREWGLEGELGRGAAAEPIVPGAPLKVAEAAFGRMVILICEDLARPIDDGELLRALGPSLCLAPVFSKPTLAHFWEHTSAKTLAAGVGTHTVIANSLVIEDLQRNAGTLETDLGTALAYSPGEAPDTGHSSSPSDVLTLRLSPDVAVVRIGNQNW